MIPGTQLQYLFIGNTQAPKQLFFVFHGYGASADGIAPLAQAFCSDFPEALFLVPQAPHPFPWDATGAMWFEISDLSEEVLNEGLDLTLPLVTNEIAVVQKHFKIQKENTVVMGFSQGAMIALGVNHWEEATLAQTVVAFSGGFPRKIEKCDPAVRYLLVHGSQDEVVIPERGVQAKERIEDAGGMVQFSLLDGLDHSINSEVLETARSFLKKTVKD